MKKQIYIFTLTIFLMNGVMAEESTKKTYEKHENRGAYHAEKIKEGEEAVYGNNIKTYAPPQYKIAPFHNESNNKNQSTSPIFNIN